MCSSPVISLSNAGKTYRVYRHPLHRLAAGLFHIAPKKQFQALTDINLEIHQGETIGIVGKNGSGKSTLLQLISGIRSPTSGTISVNGRISALLELGSGFQPEFTGRENVYLQGAIMGLGAQEMAERFSTIEAFADIGEFIDQPVKNYSSGMFMRLAFAVAISVEPDILIVDEALSVGDEAFQRKCFSRIQAIQQSGGTILLVSHSAAAVLELCNRAVLLHHGELLATGSPKTILDHYHKLLYTPHDKEAQIIDQIKQGQETTAPVAAALNMELTSQSAVAYESRGALISHPRIVNAQGQEVNLLENGQNYTFCYDVEFQDTALQVRFSMLIKTKTGLELGGLISHATPQCAQEVAAGTKLTVMLPFHCPLLPGTYFLNAGVMGLLDGNDGFLHRVIDIHAFQVVPTLIPLAGGTVDFRAHAPSSAPSVVYHR